MTNTEKRLDKISRKLATSCTCLNKPSLLIDLNITNFFCALHKIELFKVRALSKHLQNLVPD